MLQLQITSSLLTFTNNITYLARSYKVERLVSLLTCTQGQTSKKAHKILMSQIALKLQ